MKRVMNNIYEKTWNKSIPDSEIIQEIESVKNIPGFNINLGCDNSGWSLLMYAVYYSRKDLVEYLLSDPNIYVNHRSCQGNTVLHRCKDVSILRLILSHRDLDVNIQNEGGWTGLHWACYWRRKAWVKEYLLDARGDVLIRDEDGKTARYIALEQEYPDIAKIINNSRYTTLLRIPNRALLHDIIRMIIEEYLTNPERFALTRHRSMIIEEYA